MMQVNACPWCSRTLLRHVRQNGVYWFCNACWEEVPTILLASAVPVSIKFYTDSQQRQPQTETKYSLRDGSISKPFRLSVMLFTDEHLCDVEGSISDMFITAEGISLY